jgi:hypothetical protein
MLDWEESQDADGKTVATLCGTRVTVFGSHNDPPRGWCWEVRFADGQTQTGFAGDADEALAKAKRVAERFLS